MPNRDDTQEQLNDLEEEEARIMRELHDLEQRARADEHAKQRQERSLRDDPENALAALLLECEKEVRDAKGYIADHGPPLSIVRVRVGETAPKGATFLSRPKNTGVDFTTPLTTKDYTSVVKRPMFLNTIRDKIKARAYMSSDDYVDDMRLMARNTATFNKAPELVWVVQHARLLLEAAEDAVTTRQKQFYPIEDALRHNTPHKSRPTAAAAAAAAAVTTAAASSTAGKRKRATQAPSLMDTANGDAKLPSVGQSIDVYWPNYRRWFTASVVGKSGSNVHVIYEEDDTDQWIDLQSNMKWRVRNPRAAASTKSRRVQEPHPAKRRKSSTPSAAPVDNTLTAAHIPPGPASDDMEAIRSELLAKVEALKSSVEDLIKDHLDRIDRMLLRSDHLDRVLLAVEDSGESVQTIMGRIEERQSRLEKTVGRLLQQGLGTPRKDSGDRSASEDTPPPIEKSVDEVLVVSNGKREVENKAPSPKPSQIEQITDVDGALGGEPEIVQPKGSQVGRFDMEREDNRSEEKTVQNEGERDGKGQIAASIHDRVETVDDEDPEQVTTEARGSDSVPEERHPLNTREDKETAPSSRENSNAVADEAQEEDTRERQSGEDQPKEQLKPPETATEKVGTELRDGSDREDKLLSVEKGNGNNEVNQTLTVVGRKSSTEALRGAIVIGDDSSDDSDGSGNSGGSGSGSSSDGEVGTKPHNNDKDNISKKEVEKPELEFKTSRELKSAEKEIDKTTGDFDTDMHKETRLNDGRGGEKSEAEMKEKKGDTASSNANSEDSEDDKDNENERKADG